MSRGHPSKPQLPTGPSQSNQRATVRECRLPIPVPPSAPVTIPSTLPILPPRASSLPDEGHEARADFWMRGKPQLEQETHFPKASVPSGRLTSMCHVPAHLELLHWRNCLSHPASSLVNRKRAGRPASEPILGLESCVLILETSVGSSVIGWWAGGAKYARVGDSGCWRIVDESYAGGGGLTWPPCDARDKSHRMYVWPLHGCRITDCMTGGRRMMRNGK